MGTPALDYAKLFRSLSGLYLILDRDLLIHEVTETYLKATLTRRDAILGRYIFDVFPANPDEPGADGIKNLEASLRRVLEHGQTDVMAIQKYDVPRTGGEEPGFEERYWSPINSPVLGADGYVEWIIHRVEDVTDYVRASLSPSPASLARDEAEVFQRAQEVQTANERLRTADRAKTTFLAHMSHEIRTPLNAVLGLAHLALTQNPSPSLRDYLQKIQGAGDTLLHLVDQILDLSKIESGSLELERVPVSLEQTATRVQHLFEESASARGIRLRFDIDPELPAKVLGDPLRLGQVLTNLVGNALKFTAAGEVALSIRRAGQRTETCLAAFTISDTGIGMTSDQMEHLFEAFSQGDASMQRRFGGTGLGLRISQLLVQAMGGEIAVESLPGAGTQFRFTLELEAGSGEEPAAPPAAASEEPVPGPGSLEGLRVLVAEDNDVNRQIIEELLHLEGIETVAVPDGASALNRILSDPPDTFSLVLMDVQMPGLDGYDVTRRVKRDPRFAGLPIVALTAHALAEERENSLAAGMVDHVSKPISPDALYRAVGTYGRPAGNLALDVADGLVRVQRNQRLYSDLLRRFQASYADIGLRIRSHLDTGRRKEALAEIHDIKGLSLNLGLRALGGVLRELESRLRHGAEIDTKRLDRLDKTLKETQAAVSAYLAPQ